MMAVQGDEKRRSGERRTSVSDRSTGCSSQTHVSIRMGLSTLIPECGASSFPPSPRMEEDPILRGGVVTIDLAPVTSC